LDNQYQACYSPPPPLGTSALQALGTGLLFSDKAYESIQFVVIAPFFLLK
jgi:hypothetical protein